MRNEVHGIIPRTRQLAINTNLLWLPCAQRRLWWEITVSTFSCDAVLLHTVGIFSPVRESGQGRGTRLRQGAACYASLCRAPDFQLKAEDRLPSILPTAFQSLASETGISSTSHSFLYFWSILLRAFGCVKSNMLACTCI